METLLIRRRRPIAEPAGDAPMLAGAAGAGRIVLALAQLGVELDPVEQLLVDADATAPDLDRLTAGSTYPLVVLGSHLVNRPEAPVRAALLRLARRHVAADGHVLVEHHPIDWALTADEVSATPGGAPGMLEVHRDPPFVSAVSVYDVGGREVRQPFRARVLTEVELAGELERAGLGDCARIGPTWLRAAGRAG